MIPSTPPQRYVCTTVALFVLALTVPLVGRAQPLGTRERPEVSEPATQDLPLQRGWNFVSLSVLPNDNAMASVLAGADGVIVKDEGGRHYSPAHGMADLPRWAWGDAYAVYAESPVTLEVSGARIVPEASPIALEAGWNYVPYLPTAPLPIENALASILPVLVAVEAGDGRAFRPADGVRTLDVLTPGRGYQVFMREPGELIYPEASSTHSAATLDDALALAGLEVGDFVEVAGYYTPGDGGGGAFIVEASNDTPNGGTVFVPDEHTSDVITEETGMGWDVTPIPGFPETADVVFGSVTVRLVSEGDVLLTIPGQHLHGHQHIAHFKQRRSFRYETGELYDVHDQLRRFFEEHTAQGSERRIRFTYRRTTSPIRLRRLDVGQTLNAHWFGARPREDDPTFDNQPVLCEMINVANALNDRTPGTITTILLPEPEVYEYFGTIELGEGLTLKGAGGTELVTVTNDLGHTYRPVRRRAARTVLRVRADEALTHLRMLKPHDDPFWLPGDVKFVLDVRPTTITTAHNIMAAGLEDLVLSGNWRKNLQAWEEGWGTEQEFLVHLQNSPGYAGFVANRHGNRGIPQGQRLTLRNVAIMGYASHGILGDADNTWVGENVLLGNCLYNHSNYKASGDFTNFTFNGFAWQHTAWHYGTIRNLVYENGTQNPLPNRRAAFTFEIRGGDAYDPLELTGHPEYTQEDGTIPPGLLDGTDIVGLYLDLRGSKNLSPFGGIGPNITIRGVSADEPGIVVPDPTVLGKALFGENGNGQQEALYPNHQYEHILIYDTHEGEGGGGGEYQEAMVGYFPLTNAVVRNVQTERSDGRASRTLTFQAQRRDHPAWDVPQVLAFDELAEGGPTQFIADIRANLDAAGLNVFVRNSSFDNAEPTLFRNQEGTGTLQGIGSEPERRARKINAYFEDTSFRLYDHHVHDTELFFFMTRFRNCTERNTGRVSEDAGTLSLTAAGGETFLDVETDLFWSPAHTDVSGPSAGLVERVAVRTPSDDPREPVLRFRLTRPLQAGEQVNLTWEAAVRPWEDDVEPPQLP